MDQLGKSINNLSLWEVKSYVRKAQNAVLNLSEIETKVREATNNEPWGASTTLMADIARGTFNYRDREEICNMIFRRFTEKSAHEWRQIYKSLQLMEYLVKNGSERFVDDARANVSLVSMLKSFHYIDSKGVDQGINIRNRSKELTSLLNDENKIRQERKKAKENSKKFDAISSTSASSRNIGRRNSSRVGSTSISNNNNNNNDDGYENRIFGDGGVFGQRFEENRNTIASPDEFEEYDDGQHNNNSNNNNRTSKPSVQTTKVNAQPNFDLLGNDDAPSNINNEAFDNDDDDDFDDFQSATPATATSSANNSNNLSNLLNSSYSQPQHQNIPQTNNFNNFNSMTTTTTTSTSTATTASPAISQTKKNDDIFGSLLMSAKKSSTPIVTQSKPTQTHIQSSGNGYSNPPPINNYNNNNGGVVDLLDL